jgi:hypothetical protein
VQAVVFDVGETLLDESRSWSEWARWLGVSDLALAAVLGATIAGGPGHVEALRIVAPQVGSPSVLERSLRVRFSGDVAEVVNARRANREEPPKGTVDRAR